MASLKQKVDQCVAQLGCEKFPTIPAQVKEIATQLGVLDELNNKTLVQQVDYVHEVMFGSSSVAAPVVQAVVVGEGQNPQLVEAQVVPEKETPDPNKELSDWLARYPVSGGPRPDQLGAYEWFDKTFGGTSTWPLQRAAMRGEVDTIKRLCREGQNPNVKMTAWFDSEPLGWAASFGQLGAVIALIQLGADPLLPPNKAGNTPLTDAQRERHSHVVTFLQQYEQRKRGNGGSGVTGAPVQERMEQTMGSPSKELSDWLAGYPVSGGPRPDQLGAYGWFDNTFGGASTWPLQRAAMRGEVDTIKRLCREGQNPNVKMTAWFDSEPLGWAASFGQLGAVIALIQLGADPLLPPNKAGNTPLKDAQRERHSHVVTFLQEYEKRKRGKGGSGATGAPVQETMGIFDRSTHPNGGPRHDQSVICTTVACLLPFIICPTHCLSTWGCADAIDCCTSTPGFKNIPCSPCDPNSKNPLWCCAEPLGWAASFGQLHTVMVLVKNGAIPDTKNGAGQNAWTDAGRERHQHVVDWLNKWVSAGRPRG